MRWGWHDNGTTSTSIGGSYSTRSSSSSRSIRSGTVTLPVPVPVPLPIPHHNHPQLPLHHNHYDSTYVGHHDNHSLDFFQEHKPECTRRICVELLDDDLEVGSKSK